MTPQLAETVTPATPSSKTVIRRLLLFLATYLVVASILTAITTIPYINHPVARPDFSFFLGQFIGITLFLPVGVLVGLERLLNAIGIRAELIRSEGPFPAPSGLGTLVCLSNYLLVFIIALVGSSARKQQAFRILYFAFIGLLLINVGGCMMR